MSDYDRLWVAVTHAVSSFMYLDAANKEQGKILGHLASTWERSKAEVVIVDKGGSYEVVVNVDREAFKQYVTAGGIKSHQAWEYVGPDKAMQKRIVRAIKKALDDPSSSSASAS